MRLNWIIGIGAVSVLGYSGYWVYKNSKAKRETNDIAKSYRLELVTRGSKFEGLYETTFRAIADSINPNDLDTLVFSWEARLEEDDGLKTLFCVWETIKKKNSSNSVIDIIKDWFEFLYSIGIARFDEKEVIIGNNTHRMYDFEADNQNKSSRKVKVLKPYWKIDDVVIEKGYCE